MGYRIGRQGDETPYSDPRCHHRGTLYHSLHLAAGCVVLCLCFRRCQRTMPAAAECADQVDGRASTLTIELNCSTLLLQHGAVGIDHVEVADRTFAVLQ